MKHQIHALRYLWLAAILAMAGCAGTRNLYDLAKTPDQYAKAVLSHHNALGEAAIAMRADPAVSEPTKVALRSAYRKTVCSKAELTAAVATESCADGPSQKLEKAARAYESLQTATTEAELQTAIDALTGLLVDLIELTGGKR